MRHNTASSTSTEYAQILSVQNNEAEAVKNNFGDLDKSDTNAGDPLIAGQNESISGTLDDDKPFFFNLIFFIFILPVKNLWKD